MTIKLERCEPLPRVLRFCEGVGRRPYVLEHHLSFITRSELFAISHRRNRRRVMSCSLNFLRCTERR